MDKCISKAIAAFHSLRPVGIMRTTMSPQLKLHLYQTFCRTILTNGVEIGGLLQADVQRIKTIDGNIVKTLLGIQPPAA